MSVRRASPARRPSGPWACSVEPPRCCQYLVEQTGVCVREDPLVELARRGLIADGASALVELVDQAADHLAVDPAVDDPRRGGPQDHQGADPRWLHHTARALLES